MQRWQKKIISTNEQFKLEELIQKVRAETDIDFILCFAKACDTYPAATLRFAAISTFLWSFIYLLLFDFDHLQSFILLQSATFLLMMFIGRWRAYKRLCLTTHETKVRFHNRSLEIFQTLLTDNEKKNGKALLLIGIEERLATFMADPKLTGQIKEETIEKISQLACKSFKEKNYFDGLKDCIDFLFDQIPNKSERKPSAKEVSALIWLDFS